MSAVVLLGASVTIVGANGYAQTSGSASNTTGVANSATPSEGLTDYLRRTFQFTGSVRVRVEAPRGSDFTVTPADAYALSRIRLGLGYRPLKWLRFFGEGEDSRVEFYRTNPASTLSDPFEFRQGYVELGAIEGNGVKVRVGRQDLFVGSLHLISTGDWSNITKNFNVARGTVTDGKFTLDMIAGSVVLDDPTRMDRSKPGEHFYVAYGAWKNLASGASIEPYVMAKTAMNVKGKDGKLGDADTIYGGLRVFGKVRAFDYSAEAVREGGSYGNDVVQALGWVAGAGWLIRNTLAKPHVSSDFSWASGDSGRKDGHHQSFDYLYGAQQPANSLAGQVAWRNILDWRAGVDFLPLRKLTVKVDFRDYWLATVQDGLYNGFGTRTVLNAKATSTHVGEGIEAQFSYAISPKMSFGLGAGNLTPGAYLKQSGKTTGYVYPYLFFSRSL